MDCILQTGTPARNEARAARPWLLRLALAVCVGALSGVAAGEQGFYIRPHLNNITQTGATLIWETHEPDQGVIEYGRDGEYARKAEGAPDKNIHRVRMTGLEGGKEYNYRVQAGDDGQEASVKTAPAEPRPITYVVMGDSRRWGDRLGKTEMAQHAEQWDPEFYINNGDLVGNGHVYEQWPEHFQRFHSLSKRKLVVTARGNHEGSSIFDKENDWFGKYHELPGDGEPYASFTWGNTHFVLISFEQTPGAGDFLDEHMPDVDSKYTVAVQHYPVYCTGYFSPDDSRKAWGQQLNALARGIDRHDIDLDIAGHTHIYERLFPLKDGKRNDREGCTYIVNGGDIGANYPEYFSAVTDNRYTMDQPTYTVVHMGSDRVWYRTFVWSKVDEEITEIDYNVIWDDEAVPKAEFEKLEDAEGEELMAAIEALGAMMYQPAAKALVPYLEDRPEAVRRAAAKAIRAIGNGDVSPKLVPYLNDDDLVVRRQLARALEIAMDPDLTAQVAKEVVDAEQDQDTRISLIGALQFHASAAAAKETMLELLELERREPARVRQRAAYALKRVVTEEDIDLIADMFRDEPARYVTLRLAFTLNELSGRRQNVDDDSAIGLSEPGEARDEFIDTWLDWYEKHKKDAA